VLQGDSRPGPTNATLTARRASLPDDMRADPPVWQRALFVAWILLSFGTPHPSTDNDLVLGGSRAEIFWALAYLAASLGIIVERRSALTLLRASAPLLLILSLAVLSTLWSVDPNTSGRRSLELLGSTVISLYFVCRFTLAAMLETLCVAAATTAVLSLALIIFLPSVGLAPDDPSGAWQGYFQHKNVLGSFMVLGMLTVVPHILSTRGARRLAAIGGLSFLAILLIGSRSAASELAAAALAVTVVSLSWSRSSKSLRPILLGSLAVCVAALVLFASNSGLDSLLRIFGKDATLTGRTDIWQAAFDAIADRPLLGFGYKTFWDPQGAFSLYYPRSDWDPYGAHDGFLDVALSLGLAGEVLLILFLFVAFNRAARAFWRSRDWSTIWPISIVIYSILINIVEAGFLNYNSVGWNILVAAFWFATEACQRCDGAGRLTAARISTSAHRMPQH